MAIETAEQTEVNKPLWEQLGTGLFNPVVEATEAPEEEAPETIEKPAPETVETAKPEKKAEPSLANPEEPQVVLKGKARENFAKLEDAKKQESEARKAAEDRLKELEKQLKSESEQRDTRIRELETKLSEINPDDFTAKEQRYQQELTQLRSRLQMVDLQHEPEFIRKYEEPKQYHQGLMEELAVSSGVAAEDFRKSLGNPQKMEEIRDSLEPFQQREWDAQMILIRQVESQRKLALKNPDTVYEEINQQRSKQIQEQQGQLLQRNLHLARTVGNEPFEKFDFLKERTDLKQQINQTLTALAGGEGADRFTPESIFREITASIVQRDFLSQQAKTIEAKEVEIAELKKTLAERESFIQEKHGSIPRNEVNGTEKEKPKVNGRIWEEIIVKR